MLITASTGETSLDLVDRQSSMLLGSLHSLQSCFLSRSNLEVSQINSRWDIRMVFDGEDTLQEGQPSHAFD